MRRVSRLLWVPLIFCEIVGVGCSKTNESGGDSGGKGDGSGWNMPGEVGDTGTGSDSGREGKGDSDSGAVLLTDGGLPGLDHDDCQLDYAPASLTSYEADGRFVGLYAFTYDDAGNLVGFLDQATVLVEYQFEYEDTRLVRTTRTINGDQVETYEASYEYNDAGLPTAVKGRNRETADASWLYSSIEMTYENGKLSRRISWACEAEDECDEMVIERRYIYDQRGLLIGLDIFRGDRDSHWELEYDDAGNIVSNVMTLGADEAASQGNRYTYEESRLVWRDVYLEGDIITSRGYFYEDDRLSMSKDADIGRYTLFEWTDEATACSFLRAWHLLFLNSDLGSTAQEMLTRIYGYGGPSGTFY
jgi:hypothetical protein